MDPKSLYKIAYGMYIVGSKRGDKINAQIANTVVQITSEPPTLAISINKKNLTWEYINESKVFSVSVLVQDTPLSFVGQFGFKSGREINKFEGVKHKIGQTGSPVVLDNMVSYLEAKVIQSVDVGTHTIFIGEVVEGDVLADKPSLTYEYYRQVKQGSTPKTAPSYVEVKKEASQAAPEMVRYKCTICGYIYDPAVGDPDGGIKPGTAFKDIPENWTCPVCGAQKSEFEKIE